MYFFGGKVRTELESRPETWAKLSRHFFETFPQLEDVRFSHAWGGAIDTCKSLLRFLGTSNGRSRLIRARIHGTWSRIIALWSRSHVGSA